MSDFNWDKFKEMVKDNNAGQNKVFILIESCPTRNLLVSTPFLHDNEAADAGKSIVSLMDKYDKDDVEAEFGIYKFTLDQIFKVQNGGLTQEDYDKAIMIEYQYKMKKGKIKKKVINNLVMPYDINMN